MSKRDSAQSRWRWPIALSLLLLGLVLAIAFGAPLAHFLLPGGDEVVGESRNVAAGVIFAGSYLALAIGRIPGLSIDRAGVALVGAGLMVASGALPLRRRLQGGRPRDDHAAARHDDRRRQLAAVRLLRRRHRLGHGARAAPVDSAHGDRRHLGLLFGLPGQRRDLPRADAAGAGPDARAETPARCPICSRSRWRRMSGRPRRSPAIRRTS